ncbi:PepSY-like domain-containing protein [Sphingobacterium sp. LRF_L2]|uniref:PepSY-like domain-containing protein n=1 Tax=Sphingobacterium sp. LRF_L2 TaxID=3369421 RepID=UPI003F63387C
MKKLLGILALAMVANISMAQSRKEAVKVSAETSTTRSSKSNDKSSTNIPTKAQSHFGTNYKKASSTKWSADSDGSYRNEFSENGKEYTARYTKNGEWTSTERYMTKKTMPSTVLNAFQKSKYKDSKVNEYSFVKSKSYTSGVYVLNVLLNGKQLSLYYNTAGKLLKTL